MSITVDELNRKVITAKVNTKKPRRMIKTLIKRIKSELQIDEFDKSALVYVAIEYMRKKGYEVDMEIVEQIVEDVIE